MLKNIILLFLFPFISFSQTLLKGEISNSGDVEGIHVFNKTHEQYTVTNANGEFKILVHQNDTIIFSAIQYQLKELIITPKTANQYQYIVLETHINELDAVYIMPILSGDLGIDSKRIKTKNHVSAISLGLPNATVTPPTQAERRLQTASDLNPQAGGSLGGAGAAVSFDAIINGISGRTKELKNIVANERKTAHENNVILAFKKIIINDFKIPEHKLYDFIYYASEDPLFNQIIATKNNMLIYDFIYTKVKNYRKQVGNVK